MAYGHSPAFTLGRPVGITPRGPLEDKHILSSYSFDAHVSRERIGLAEFVPDCIKGSGSAFLPSIPVHSFGAPKTLISLNFEEGPKK